MDIKLLVTLTALLLGSLIGFTVFFAWLSFRTRKKKYVITSIIGFAVFIVTSVLVNLILLPALPPTA